MLSLQRAGVFFLNIVIATIGTGVLESPLVHFLNPAPITRLAILRQDCLTIVVAFGLGYSIFRGWHSVTSKWIWLPGVCWLGIRLLLISDGNHGAIWEAQGEHFSVTTENFTNWSLYTLPCLRTVFYTVGAVCRARVEAK